MGFDEIYPPVMTQLLWKMTIEIVDFSNKKMVIVHSYVKPPEAIKSDTATGFCASE